MPEAWHAARTMRVLELLAFQPLSAPQLAGVLGAHPRTVRRVLERLVDDDYLIQDDDRRRRYHPTMRLVAMAGQVLENSELVDRARPYVVLLHERTGAVAHLVMPSYGSVVCVAHCGDGEVECPRVREVVAAHCTAGGKVLLAWRGRWRDSLLASPLKRFTDRTITDPLALRAELDVVRDRGYAHEDGEYMKGRRAVAAPVVTRNDDVIAALVIDGLPISDSAVGAVVRTAAQLSTNLTGRP
jgi:DNA-binding IclR family transcriptional regulator